MTESAYIWEYNSLIKFLGNSLISGFNQVSHTFEVWDTFPVF